MTGELLARAEGQVYVPEMLRAPYPSSKPSATRADADHIDIALGQLTDFVGGQRVLVLSGAGCSTESGIPDYRSPATGRGRRRPMGYQEFMGSTRARTRYGPEVPSAGPECRERSRIRVIMRSLVLRP